MPQSIDKPVPESMMGSTIVKRGPYGGVDVRFNPNLAESPVHTIDLSPVPQATQDFYALLDQMRSIHDTKNKDYADSKTDPWLNFRMSEEIGVPAHIGSAVRMGDKYKRVNNLMKREWRGAGGPAVKDESVEDTLLDLAVYALITLLLHREWKQKQESEA